MWLATPFGFYSIVKKPGDTRLTVRTRIRQDLDNLRTLVPGLGPTIEGAGTDYRFRAVIDPVDLAIGLGEIAQGIDYSNFKAEVQRRQGPDRARLYGRVWAILRGLR